MIAIPIQAELHSLIMAGHFALERHEPWGRRQHAYFVATAFTFDRWPIEATAIALVWEPVEGWQMIPSSQIIRTTAPTRYERARFVKLFAELLPVIGRLAENGWSG